MARVAVAELKRQQQQAVAARMAETVQRKGKPRRASPAKVREATVEMSKSGDWSRATPRHLVDLYAWCHERVYGVKAEIEHDGKAALNASFGAEAAARRMLDQEFRSDPGSMASYVRWVWRREAERERLARESGRERGRIGWQLMFSSRSLFTDYMVGLRRAHG